MIEKGTPEWDRMWEELAQHELNNGNCVCENEGFRWKYMGTIRNEEEGWLHLFTHAFHPQTSERVDLRIPARSEGRIPNCS